MRQYTAASGEVQIIDGPIHAVRVVDFTPGGGAALALDNGASLQVFGYYTIPAPSGRPFRQVKITGPATVQFAEEATEDLGGGATQPPNPVRLEEPLARFALAGVAYAIAKTYIPPAWAKYFDVWGWCDAGAASVVVDYQFQTDAAGSDPLQVRHAVNLITGGSVTPVHMLHVAPGMSTYNNSGSAYQTAVTNDSSVLPAAIKFGSLGYGFANLRARWSA